jgi:adenylylsulfate kinase
MHVESHSRSLVKAVTYRVFGSATTAGIVFFYSGSAKVAGGAGLIDAVSKIVLYFLHERAWHYIPFGREKAEPEYEI